MNGETGIQLTAAQAGRLRALIWWSLVVVLARLNPMRPQQGPTTSTIWSRAQSQEIPGALVQLADAPRRPMTGTPTWAEL
jgi:hypothetical protein